MIIEELVSDEDLQIRSSDEVNIKMGSRYDKRTLQQRCMQKMGSFWSLSFRRMITSEQNEI